MIFLREIYPIGHGGFAFEMIGEYSVIFDCGSSSCPQRVSQFIKRIQSHTASIDRLFISHFDNDHVNCISELLNSISVHKAVIPYIPPEYRIVFNSITGGAYQSLRSLFLDNQRLQDLEGEDTSATNIWEWIAKSLLAPSDWWNLKKEMISTSIDTHRLSDPIYIESKKKDINRCFKNVFGSAGPNSKGIIMLSQRIDGTINSNMINGREEPHDNMTAALYLGDAHVKGKQMVRIVQSFLQRHYRCPLLFTQIPHHGSPLNSGWNFDKDITSTYYYYQDHSSQRLKKNKKLYESLTSSKKLLEVRDVDTDLVSHTVSFI